MKSFIKLVLLISFLSFCVAGEASPTLLKEGATSLLGISIGSDGAAVDSKALLDVKSTTKGILIPRMTTTQRDAISSPRIGSLIWNTTSETINQYDSGGWKGFATLTGNEVLTNKTISALSNTIAGLTNSSVASGAAIDWIKLATGGGASRIPFTDASTSYLTDSNKLFWVNSSGYLKVNGSMTLGSTADPSASGLDIASGGLKVQSLSTAGPAIVSGSGVFSTEAQLAISRGGTGQSTANAALNALLPSQSGNSGKFLSSDGTNSSWLSATSGTPLTGVAKSADYTATTADDVIYYTLSSSRTLTLYSASGNAGKMVRVVVVSAAGDNTLAITSGSGINGGTTAYLSEPYEEATFLSNGTQWYIINQKLNELVTASQPTLTNYSSYSISAGQWGDLASFTLTPGLWKIDASIIYYSSSATTTGYLAFAVTPNSGNSSSGLVFGDNYMSKGPKTTTADSRDPLYITGYYVLVTSTTTYYLKTNVETSTSGLQVAFRLNARKERTNL